MFFTLVSQISAVFMIAACGAAAWKGDIHARSAGVAVALGWLGSAVAERYIQIGSPLYTVILIDLLLLLLFGGLSYFSDRVWPVFATVLHALGLAAHVSYMFELQIGVPLYYTALTVSGNGVLIAIAYGTLQAWRERAATRGGTRAELLAAAR